MVKENRNYLHRRNQTRAEPRLRYRGLHTTLRAPKTINLTKPRLSLHLNTTRRAQNAKLKYSVLRGALLTVPSVFVWRARERERGKGSLNNGFFFFVSSSSSSNLCSPSSYCILSLILPSHIGHGGAQRYCVLLDDS